MKISNKIDDLRSLTYSLDACYVGLYFWLGNCSLRIGGVEVDDNPYYPYKVPTLIGFGFALPNYLSWHTPFEQYKQIEKRKLCKKSGVGFGMNISNCDT